MYVLDEYLMVVGLVVGVSFAGWVICMVVVILDKERHFFDSGFSPEIFALPPSWPRLWLAMRIADRWRAARPTLRQHARLWLLGGHAHRWKVALSQAVAIPYHRIKEMTTQRR
jgi:hypothetical protein